MAVVLLVGQLQHMTEHVTGHRMGNTDSYLDTSRWMDCTIRKRNDNTYRISH